ncbi:MAG TPA: DUF922 domain-containing protein, partial [Puia sp.]|nr:DUF922 domain-containing protein [Puia sp.]
SQFLLIMFLSSFTVPNSSLIDWSADRRLTWSDFKSSPDSNSPNAALTATNIKFDFSYSSDKGFQYHISCQFDKNKSWGRVKTDYILSHEQGHFDIAEIYARKLYKAFKEYNPDIEKANKEVNKIYEKVMHELTETQKQYDHETNFSINKEKQMEWLKKINEDLKSLQAYSDYH